MTPVATGESVLRTAGSLPNTTGLPSGKKGGGGGGVPCHSL
ncbi:hypothetical protein [Methanogenium cariaci]|nr:hypothetical protein [Methanogenium cariaci]